MADTPRRAPARKNTQKTIGKAEAQRIALAKIAQGWGVRDAMAAVNRGEEAYRTWKKTDPAFAAELAKIRETLAGDPEAARSPVPDFPDFCEELGEPLHPHQLALWDVIEGREPRWLHPSFRYTRGARWESRMAAVPGGRVVVNVPPGHAKTTSISINYCTWLIYKNPNVKIVVVCKDQTLAKHILGAVKFRLTSPVYREMHAKYGPQNADGNTIGFEDKDQSWTQTEIYVLGKDDGAKDPTMSALGIGGRIYGARSDVIILDDAVTLANVNEYDKQRRWIDQEVESRLDGVGLLAILGTRVAPIDLYSTMREVEDIDEEKVYTYFSMPAVLEEGDGKPENWVALWPEMFPARRLRKIRRDEATWALVYQQQDVAEDAVFNHRAVEASVNGSRFPGPMTAAGLGHRQGGMDGLYVIGGLDPATVGATAMQVWGVDKVTQKRYVLDGFNQTNTTPTQMRDAVKRFTDLYNINEWVIERNAFQRFLTQDEELTTFLRSRGCKLTEHITNDNKYDADFGIQSMAQLFLTCGEPVSQGHGGAWRKTPEKALIELPSARQNAWVSEYINQMVVWQPSGMKQLQKTDLVMAAWFCEIAAKRILGIGRKRLTHLNNPYAAVGRLRDRAVVNLADLRAEMQERKAA